MTVKRISDLPAASTISGTDLVFVMQGGISKQAAVSLFPSGGGGGGGATTLAALTDVNVSAVNPGDTLYYDSATAKWKPTNVYDGGNF
jgi:hypothetical protein